MRVESVLQAKDINRCCHRRNTPPMRNALIFATAAALMISGPAIQQFATAAPVGTDVVLQCVYPGALKVEEKSFDFKMMIAIRGRTATMTMPLFPTLGPSGSLEAEETPSHFIIKLQSQGGSVIINRTDGAVIMTLTEDDKTPVFGTCTPVDRKF
jgi:hypothetical protein